MKLRNVNDIFRFFFPTLAYNLLIMKKIFLLSFLLIGLAASVNAQDTTKSKTAEAKKDTIKLYQKFPNLPMFNILTPDSTLFSTYDIPEGNPVAFFFFDPDCKHCQAATTLLLNGMDSIKNIDFYFVSFQHNLKQIQEFYDKNEMKKYKNIKLIGRDPEYFFNAFYDIKFTPDLILYNKYKKLMKLIEGPDISVSAVYTLLHSDAADKK